ncbi:MAG: radical SAM protein [Clostridia bacterium]|nr:radical SAM protein [Clostridia bacterium]
MSALDYKCCTLCPRECKADRTQAVGFCGMGDKVYAAKAMVHTGEEPCISGTAGSGAIFFSGCVLRCRFCQNHVISHDRVGKEISEERLCDIILELQSQNVHNINMVSATQFYPSVLSSLDRLKDKLKIPIVWNTGGYEKTDAVVHLSEHCDVFLQDIKFYSNESSLKYASCKDYFEHAMKATEKMVEIKGKCETDSDGIIKKGVIVRHLVLPSNRTDSINLLKELKKRVGSENIILSLMSQYTPPSFDTGCKELGRRITSFEYQSVCECALELGFEGYFQQRESAQSMYTPIFDLSGI